MSTKHAPITDVACAELLSRCQALDRLKRDLRGDIDELMARAADGPRRNSADCLCRAEAFADVLARLP